MAVDDNGAALTVPPALGSPQHPIENTRHGQNRFPFARPPVGPLQCPPLEPRIGRIPGWRRGRLWSRARCDGP